ncbi:MAG: Redoxin domain protein [Candidatus Solibacter sp.]|nr:Redoxin domain protein [Candidatus Solibacter sp.]
MNPMKKYRAVAACTLLALAAPFARTAVLPRPAPDLAINLGQGKQVKLSQFKGKTVVLAFILTYCSHCQKVMGVLSKLNPDYAPRNVQFLASATEDMAAAALPAFLRQYAPPFPTGYNSNLESVSFLQHSSMLMLYMPALVFIDPDGMIRAQYEGRDSLLEETSVEKNIRAKLEELLPKTAAKKGPPKKSKPR